MPWLLQLLREIQGLELYGHVANAAHETLQCSTCSSLVKKISLFAERLTIFLLLAPSEAWGSIAESNCQVMF